MSEFKGHCFGLLPPGCFEDDPRAPWNEEDVVRVEDLLDWIYNALREDGWEPEYKGMRIKCQGLYVDVSEAYE